MSDPFGNHIVGFPTRRLIFLWLGTRICAMMHKSDSIYIFSINLNKFELTDLKICSRGISLDRLSFFVTQKLCEIPFDETEKNVENVTGL